VQETPVTISIGLLAPDLTKQMNVTYGKLRSLDKAKNDFFEWPNSLFFSSQPNYKLRPLYFGSVAVGGTDLEPLTIYKSLLPRATFMLYINVFIYISYLLFFCFSVNCFTFDGIWLTYKNKRLSCRWGTARQRTLHWKLSKWIICSRTNAPCWNVCLYKVPWHWNPG